ncbi:Dak phosphatase [Cellulomonas flavigena DSM 20109]|uniref:Dak phosphatase n=1 Tax=Cellulomonas flavigena (strain ATCC 482 / DSM 20109 / BCRC 11376 / JCM 18109 / NBRC 3775 / NCIMB 8073 / NRS 134) TaxID=446466 RepID=D5UGU7_CELFN|nr:DAK2 domain-containing protein [Cellulomonas flavigena]ADG75195.1 Dak phosphatase [Cellulomonas flavigena DSM 20109]
MEVAAQHVVLDDHAVRAWATGALTACRAARELIDAVNVFPVPDADTGSNVALTLTGGVEALVAAPGGPGGLLTTFASGAARAARGNSGIILSQWLVGLADGLTDAPGGDATEVLVAGLERADRAARAAVPDPQEGTVLTVAREVAAHARRGVGAAAPAGVLAAATASARADLARLSAGHDVLRAARVVDAGACALLVVLDALVHTLATGTALTEADLDLGWLPRTAPEAVAGCAPALGGAFEVMVLVDAAWPGAGGLVAALQDVGDAVAVVDAGDCRHAHVHCDDPAAAIGLVPAEVRRQVVVRRVDEPAPAARGLVVLTRSPGLAAWYATCGAVTLVGPAPTAQQVRRAAVDTRAERAVVVAAGVPADDGSTQDGSVDVLAVAGDGPAVVTCLALVADPQVAPEAGLAALARLRHGTTADDVVDLAATLVADVPGAQGVTLVHGADVPPATTRAVADAVAAAHPQTEVVLAGPAVHAAWWVGVD